MTTDSRRPRIAWLVNLFSDPEEQHAHGAELLRVLSTQLGADVVPYYCIDNGATALDSIEPAERFTYTRARLAALLGEHDLNITEPVILSAGDDPSAEDKAEALAQAVNGDDVLFSFVHSQSRSGLERFVLGSVSEAFFTRATRPVLLLNPRAQLPAAYNTIVFGTDLGETCTSAFSTLLPIARMMDASVHIEHQLLVRELSPFMKSEATREQYDAEIGEMREHATDATKRLLVLAEAAGVHATSSVEVEGPSISPGEGIEGRARKRETAFIAVPAHGDRRRAGNIGSTALWLMRHARRPVLVIPRTA